MFDHQKSEAWAVRTFNPSTKRRLELVDQILSEKIRFYILKNKTKQNNNFAWKRYPVLTFGLCIHLFKNRHTQTWMNKVYVEKSKESEVAGTAEPSVIRGNCSITFCQGRNVSECINRVTRRDLHGEYQSTEKNELVCGKGKNHFKKYK